MTTPAKPILRGVNSDGGGSSASAQTPRRETPKRVNWADDRAVGQGLGGQGGQGGGLAAQAPLEFVKTFDDKEAPAQVRAQYVQVASPHQPKPVPAAPRGQPHAPRKRPRPVQVAGAFDPQPTFPPENFGYETPYAHAAPLGMDSIQGGGIEGPTTGPGPVYYTPPSKYKTPDDIAKEREVLWNTPETPETTRRRRQGQLREAALSLKPDPMSVPIGIMVS